MNLCKYFWVIPMNHSVTLVVFFHWLMLKLVQKGLLTLSSIALLILPNSLFAGLTSRNVGLSKKLSSFFFSIWVFFHEHSRITGLQGKGGGIFLTPHYQFHPLYRHLVISREIAAGSSHLHIASSRARTQNLWFPSASR